MTLGQNSGKSKMTKKGLQRTESDLKTKRVIPEDKRHRVFFTVLIIGIVCMMPFDILVTVDGYWEYKFRDQSYSYVDTSTQPLTSEQKEFETYLSIAGSVPSTLAVILHAFVGYKFSVDSRSIVALCGITTTFVGIAVLAYLDSDDWTTAFMIANLILAGMVNAFRAWLRATSSANMAKFPVKYTGSLSNGLMIGSLIPVLLNITILSLDVDEQMAGFGCFAFACLFSLIGLLAYLRMSSLDFYIHFTTIEQPSNTSKLPDLTWSLFGRILRSIWRYALTLFVCVSSTLMIYPGAGSLVEPVDPTGSNWHQIYFTQVTFFLNYAVFAVLGTLAAGLIQRPRGTSRSSQCVLLAASLARTAMVPLILLCNLAPNNRSKEVLLESDVAFVALIAIFSLSEGYLVTLALMFGPKAAERGSRELAAAILIMFNATAASVGTALGNLIVKAL